jgi:hypothetical protein
MVWTRLYNHHREKEVKDGGKEDWLTYRITSTVTLAGIEADLNIKEE